MTYTTDNGVNNWQYNDYTAVGGASNASHVPQTLRQLDSSGNPTPEEFHYLYDSAGHLTAAGFAMQPQSGYTPPTGQPYYSNVYTPSWRAHVTNDIDAAGQLLNLDYYWENQSGNNYNQQYITGFQYAYDPVTMLKTTATFLDPNSSGNGWVTDHVEGYLYDGIRDYLTTANYNDSYSNPSDTWGYDAAGNRTSDANTGSSTYDNLNRQLTSGVGSYSNDILGNRTGDPSGNQYGWDNENRLISFQPGSNPAWSYTYRTDGMRVSKGNGNASTSYAYDAQMGIEDTDFGSNPAVTDYAIGGRGVDRIAKTAGGTTSVAYPIYDGHGNMVSTLSYSGTAFSLGNQRAYDSWGNIRNSDSSGDPKGRYCAALGHKSDDESGLTYMRARYYDAVAGRFMSEDSAMNGRNWYTYCSNEPICQADKSGAAEGNAMEQEFYAIIEGMKQWLENNGMSGFWANKISCGATFMLCMKAALEAFSLAVGFFQTAGAAADDAAFLFNVGLWNQGATAMAASAGAGLMGMVYMAVGLISLQGAYDALELSIDGGGDD